jgi:hypothetical protein
MSSRRFLVRRSRQLRHGAQGAAGWPVRRQLPEKTCSNNEAKIWLMMGRIAGFWNLILE